VDALSAFLGPWRLSADLPGAEQLTGRVRFELMGNAVIQRTTIPGPVPDSCSVILESDNGGYIQHYFDARGVARRYSMTFDGRTWTLERTAADLSALDFCQRFVGHFSDDLSVIDGEWQISDDGQAWRRDFGLRYERMETAD
jgi:hypothetical protein